MDSIITEQADKRIQELEQKVTELTAQLKNNLKFNERFLTEFSEGFATYKIGDDFFNALVRYIYDKTDMDYVFVGKLLEVDDENARIETIAFTRFGNPVANIKYELEGTPCEKVMEGRMFMAPGGCKGLFKNDEILLNSNIEGYIGYPLFNAAGKPIGLIAVMHQTIISEQHKIAAILRVVAKRAELELERIQYQEILEEKTKSLLEANNSLELSNKNLEQFAYMASHDLQEPLRKIMTFSNLIRDKMKGDIDDGVKSYFERIINAASRMKQLMADLLDYSRLQNIRSSFVTTDLNAIIKSVQTDLEFLIEEKGASIESDTLPVIDAIPMQMNQLFTNLVSNSLKFSRAGIPPFLRITSRLLNAAGLSEHPQLNKSLHYYELCFRDNGIGFSQQYAEQVFIIFQRLNGRSEYPGTGIGLAICKKIVAFHQGEIYAESTENEGAAFFVLVPVHQAKASM